MMPYTYKDNGIQENIVSRCNDDTMNIYIQN